MPYSTIDDDTGLNKSGSQSVAIANSFSVCPERIEMESSVYIPFDKRKNDRFPLALKKFLKMLFQR